MQTRLKHAKASMSRTEKGEDSCCWDKYFQHVGEQMKDGNEEGSAMTLSYAKK